MLGWVNLAMVKILMLVARCDAQLEALALVLGLIAITSIDFGAVRIVGRAGDGPVAVRREDDAW